MSDLFRDSTAGQLIRLVTRNRVLQYPEEHDPSLYEKYINVEKSANLARTGTTQSKPNDANEKAKDLEQTPALAAENQELSANSSTSTLADPNALVNVPSGQPVDPERGRDGHVVDWFGDNDQEVSVALFFCRILILIAVRTH
jgi:MFS transporter, DHA1 family, multidrug resistance protein